MTIREQIVTVRVRYDDGEENACSDEEACCGLGACEERCAKASANIVSTMQCCGGAMEIEVLQETEPREVLTESSFKE